jgi:ribosomal protein S6--L-glutamate ligase
LEREGHPGYPGGVIVGAMERMTTTRGEFRSNFHLGGRVSVAHLSDDEKTLAIAATKACGLDMAGVDILRTKEGPKVIEVNANPGLEGITQATGMDIAGEIIRFMVEVHGR